MALTIEKANTEIQALIDQQTASGKKVITESAHITSYTLQLWSIGAK